MEKRRLGRIGHQTSVVVYGAAMLGDVTQDVADASIAEALEFGINHFDTAASYGEAELRLGPWTSRFGDDIFLATKTGERERDAAWAQINASLERLQTDHFDLIQLHAVGDLEDLDRAVGPSGALEAAVRARDEGIVKWIGITGHGHGAPSTHLEALKRFPFDAVLSPWNYILAGRDDYRRDFLALVAECQRQDVGLRTIKTIARRNWLEGAEKTTTTWYEPLQDPEALAAAVAFCLRQEGITGIASASDVRLLAPTVAAAERAAQMTDAEVEAALTRDPDYSSPFLNMPW